MAAGKHIITKRLDVDKGDMQRQNLHARLVGRELKLKDHWLDVLPATPPLESLRLLFSMCASNQKRARPYLNYISQITIIFECFLFPLIT